MNNKKNLTIGCLARELGICTETIRYYHRIGLLPFPQCPEGRSVRIYSEIDLQLLKFIKRAQRLGFSLRETRMLIDLSKGKNCELVQPIAIQKLAELKAKITEMVSMRDAIAHLLEGCKKNENNTDCPVIEALLHENLSLPLTTGKASAGASSFIHDQVRQ
jgi:MerR family mercuric resistance operon transcriptional regulator